MGDVLVVSVPKSNVHIEYLCSRGTGRPRAKGGPRGMNGSWAIKHLPTRPRLWSGDACRALLQGLPRTYVVEAPD